jgi:hypothetical protein
MILSICISFFAGMILGMYIHLGIARRNIREMVSQRKIRVHPFFSEERQSLSWDTSYDEREKQLKYDIENGHNIL